MRYTIQHDLGSSIEKEIDIRMGYDIHITRNQDWSAENGDPILLNEWLTYLAGDPTMRLDGYAEAMTSTGATIRIKADGLAVWTAYSGHEEGGNMAWFLYTSGNIVVKNPDVEIRQKMWMIAQALHAHVQGDDGEVYNQEGHSVDERGDHDDTISQPSRPWWRFWR